MRARSLPIALLAAAALAACQTPDLPVAAADRSPAAPLGNHTGNNCVNFNVPPIGAVFGPPTPPGTVVWVEQLIPVSITKFLFAGGGSAYGSLRIEPAPAVFTLAA